MNFKKIFLAGLLFVPSVHMQAEYMQIDERTFSEKMKETFGTVLSNAKEKVTPILVNAGEKAKEKITQFAYSDPRLVALNVLGGIGATGGLLLAFSGIRTSLSQKAEDKEKSGISKILVGSLLTGLFAGVILKSKHIIKFCE
ncbi:hypothetical protein HYX58_01265 [Candidatus Dependentiae bacterium]|nr:hypothetical protein [Candidatus Dependentiae bacterium]